LGQGGPKRNQECTSNVFRESFRITCQRDTHLVNTFLNLLFNNLNYIVSEFGSSIKEFHTALTRRAPSDFQQSQRKITVMFELSVNLLRVLEGMILEAPSIFLTNELNLTRLIELLLFVLNRTTAGTDAVLFNNILSQENLASLGRVTRVAILCPVVGILLNLDMAQPMSNHQSVVSALADAPGFNLQTFEYVSNFDWMEALFGDPTVDRLEQFGSFVDKIKSYLEKKQAQIGEIARSPSLELCSICYADPIDTIFEPCHHRSCHKCISRHLLNTNRCFFCNAEVKSTVLETTPPNPMK